VEQVEDLLELAFKCPLLGGDAVFKARAMLALAMDTFYVDDELCQQDSLYSLRFPAQQDTAHQDEELAIKLFPNPAKDYAILQLSKEVEGLRLKVTDAIGRAVMNSDISTVGNRYIINTASFSSGVYYISLYNDTGKLYTGKLSIFIR